MSSEWFELRNRFDPSWWYCFSLSSNGEEHERKCEEKVKQWFSHGHSWLVYTHHGVYLRNESPQSKATSVPKRVSVAEELGREQLLYNLLEMSYSFLERSTVPHRKDVEWPVLILNNIDVSNSKSRSLEGHECQCALSIYSKKILDVEWCLRSNGICGLESAWSTIIS